MRVQFKIGTFNVVKHGEDNFDISVWNLLDRSNSSLKFLTKEQLKQIKDEISRVLKTDERGNGT